MTPVQSNTSRDHTDGASALPLSASVPGETYHESLEPVPDIDNQRDAYDFACFEMVPGDCTIHHGLTVHGAPGNSSSRVRRRAYITRWAGEDVTYKPRPNLQRMLRDPGYRSRPAAGL